MEFSAGSKWNFQQAAHLLGCLKLHRHGGVLLVMRMRTWGGYKQRKCVREYGDSLCSTGTVKPANALHLSPLPSAALVTW